MHVIDSVGPSQPSFLPTSTPKYPMASSLGKQCLVVCGKLVACGIILSIGAFWSFVVICESIYQAITKGFGTVFYYKNRAKGLPPVHYLRWDAETRHNPGASTKKWNHAYITIPRTSVRFHYVHSGVVPSHISISAIDGETAVNGDFEEETADHHRPKLMLCVHGYPECWFSWRHVLRAYDDQPDEGEHYFVVAIDLRGYGDSDMPGGRMAYHMNHLMEDIRGLVNAFGYRKCIYVGHDWGGGIGWSVAKTYQDILEKFIVMNSPHDRAFLRGVRTKPVQILRSWYIFFYQIPFLPEITFRLRDYGFLDDVLRHVGKGGITNPDNRPTDEEMEVSKYALRRSLTGPINYYRATVWPFCQPGPPLLYPATKVDGEPEFSVPILVIWGDRDHFLLKEMGEACKDCINPSNGSKVVLVEGASHWVQQDEPEKTLEIMREFLK